MNDEQKTKEQLIESNRKLSMMIEHLPGMGYACKNDEHWTMTFVSSGCEELTGYTPEELLDNTKVSYNHIIYPIDFHFV